MNTIEFRNIFRKFGKCIALNQANFSVKKGTVTALVGANGAGKTTSMKIMNRLIRYEGELRLFDTDAGNMNEADLKTRLFFVPEEKSFPAVQLKDFSAQLRSLKGKIDMVSFSRFIEEFGLTAHWNKKTRELSKGMQSSLYLAVALASPAELLVLDEPLSGQDPLVRNKVIAFLKERVMDGDKTVLYSSHILEEVEESSDEAVILHRGKCLSFGPIDDLKERYSEQVMEEKELPENLEKISGVLLVKKGASGIKKVLLDKTLLKENLTGKNYSLTLKEIYLYLTLREESHVRN